MGPHAVAPSAATLAGLDLDALEEGAVAGRGAGAGGKLGGKGPDLAAGELAAAARAKRAGDAMDVDAQPKVRQGRQGRREPWWCCWRRAQDRDLAVSLPRHAQL